MATIEIIAGIFLFGGMISAVLVTADLKVRPQPMKVMNYVWILTALWASFPGLLAYYAIGRRNVKSMPDMAMDMGGSGNMKMQNKEPMKMNMPMDNTDRIFPEKVALSTLHCGAGCTIADIIGETITLYIPFVIFGSMLAAQWTLDYIMALVIGVCFQYAVIHPMLRLSFGKSMLRALKIDFLSLTAWQIGMYGFMALVYFVFFPYGLPKTGFTFWFMMQIAMYCGFIVAYPVNWLLIRSGVKPEM